jgi:hypothetical protein
MLRRLSLALAVLVAALAALELGTRGARALSGSGYSPEALRGSIRAGLDAMTADVPRAGGERAEAFSNVKDAYVLHPYFGFEAKGTLAEDAEWTARFASGVAEEAWVLMILGGSVAGGIGNGLLEMAPADPRLAGREVVIVNFGRGANRQPQQLVRALFMLGSGVRPDAIVAIDGFNESAFGHANAEKGVHPLYPYWPRWGHLALSQELDQDGLRLAGETLVLRDAAVERGRALLDSPLLASAVLGPLLKRRFDARASAWVAAQERYTDHLAARGESETARGPAFPEDGRLATQAVVDTWFDCSVALHGYCAANGIEYLHVLQPTLYDEGSKVLTPEEIERGKHSRAYREGVLSGYPLMRAHAGDFERAGVRFVDLSMLFEDVAETIYTDYCHFNELGTGMAGGRVLDELLGSEGN